MKILFFTESLASGGAERQLVGLATMLHNNHHRVKIITWTKNQFFLKTLIKENIEYELCELGNKRFIRPFLFAKAIIKYNPECIISFKPSANLAVCLASIITRAKILVSERSNTQKYTLKKKITFLLYSLSDYIVTNSNAEYKNIQNLCPKLRDKLTMIPNFVDTNKFVGSNRIIDNKKTIEVLSIGRIDRCKNIIRLLEAIAIMKNRYLTKKQNLKFTWIGYKQDEQYYEEIMSVVSKLGIRDYITFADETDKIEKIYCNYDVLCLPSLYEGYPNVVIEAMSSGLPILCSRVCENPSIVEEGVNGFLFDPYNIDEMVLAFEKYFNTSDGERKKMGVRNREKVLANNSKEVFLKKYLSIIER